MRSVRSALTLKIFSPGRVHTVLQRSVFSWPEAVEMGCWSPQWQCFPTRVHNVVKVWVCVSIATSSDSSQSRFAHPGTSFSLDGDAAVGCDGESKTVGQKGLELQCWDVTRWFFRCKYVS